ncbi:MAG TPA: competence/damage-inducible protein A [Polyangiaceae bacterium]|jgi:nicotinamide-nucleotide amidase|nr:competence/damage-inducible protein A [Polyangiaceae bacterium]
MSAAVLTIGTEVVRGEIENTNASWLCERMTDLGMEVTECASVADDERDIRETLERLGWRHSVIVTTGGLGPTTDDLTTRVVADTLGVPLVRDTASLELIKAKFTRAAVEFSESNAKQADFPQGADILANDWGTAPGFRVQLGKSRAFFLPGVPREMKPMFARYIEPALTAIVSQDSKRRIAQTRLRVFGLAESKINDMLKGVERQFDVIIGYRAHMPQIEIKTLASRESLAEAEAASEQAAAAISERLGNFVYGRGARDLPQVIGEALSERGWRLGLAESCTGGLISDLITREPASHYFSGSVVCYSNTSKVKLLGVPADLIERHGAVSEEVVRAMAEGARGALDCEASIAVSGIAGPSGATAEKPLGLVHWAVSSPLGTVAKSAIFPHSRRQNQLRAAYAGLDLLRRQLAGLTDR